MTEPAVEPCGICGVPKSQHHYPLSHHWKVAVAGLDLADIELEMHVRGDLTPWTQDTIWSLIAALRQAQQEAERYKESGQVAIQRQLEAEKEVERLQQQAQEWEDTANATAEIVHKLEQQVADLERDNQELHESSLGFQELAIKYGKLKNDYERLQRLSSDSTEPSNSP